MKKKINKDKIKSILFYIGTFLYSSFLFFCIYDGLTYNKYGMGEYHDIKAFCFSFLLCFVLFFGGVCYIKYLEKELDKADREIYYLREKISVEEMVRILHDERYGKDD